MKKIRMIIERSADLFGAYAKNVKGVTGCGNTIEEAKQLALETIRIIKEHNSAENIPEILKGDYEIVYKFDVQSFLKYYNGVFTPAALSALQVLIKNISSTIQPGIENHG